MMSSLRQVQEMMISNDKVGGWVKKGQNHDDVILECPLTCLFKEVMNLSRTDLQIFEQYLSVVKRQNQL